MGDCLLTPILCQIGTERPLHICSYDCDSHFQPHFESVLEDAQLTLQNLFSPQDTILRYIREPLSYPTQDHIRLSRVIGFTQHKLYFTDSLLPEEKRNQARSDGDLDPCIKAHLALAPSFDTTRVSGCPNETLECRWIYTDLELSSGRCCTSSRTQVGPCPRSL